MGKKLWKALTAVFLAAALLLGCVPVALAAEEKTLQIGVISDLHYFSKAQAGGYNGAFMRDEGDMGKLFLQSEGILESALAALAAHAKKNGMKYVLIPGDLTKEGELAGHKAVAARLERFEKETGLQVAVVGGNHDLNNGNGVDYSTGERRPAEMTSPQQFREIYKNLGFDLPNAAYYTPPEGTTAGMLSYAVDLGPDYRLIALDVHKYDIQLNGRSEPGYTTGGTITDGLMEWAVGQCRQAVRDGKTVIGMAHHNLTPHVGAEDWIFLEFLTDNYLRDREALAQAGMHFFFSGHIHQGEIGDCVNDDGEVLFDIATASIASYPGTFREVRFASRGKNDVTAAVKTYELDCVKPVTANGVTYPSPFSKASFGLSYNEKGIREFIPSLLQEQLGRIFQDIQNMGGVNAFLKSSGIDLGSMLGGMLDAIPIIGARNVNGLLGDIFKQMDRNYVNQPERTLGILNEAVSKLLDMEVSPLPSTAFIGSYGLGDKNRPGTFADLANEVLIYTYGRGGGAERDKFLQDALERLESGETADKLVGVLLDMLLHDLLQDEILPTLRLNLSPAIATPVLRLTLGALLDGFLRLILLGDNSFAAVVDLVFKVIDLFDLAPYTSLDATVDLLLEEYWTPSQSEGIGYQLATILRRMVGDQNGVPDTDATLRYTGPRKVVPTQEEFRLPSMVTQLLPGPGDEYDRAIGWFTKYSVQGTDVRVWDSSGRDVTKSLDIKKTTEPALRTFPGVDLGLAGFIDAKVDLVRHTVEIGGLEPLHAYSCQVGDASRGWWSPRGVIKAPLPGNQDTTFLSFTDMQAQTPIQYARSWGKLSEKAMALYPGALLAVSPGDLADNASNLHQWGWFFNCAQKTLRQLPLMPAPGNHENKDAALQSYFPFGSLPEQEARDDGLYYSFDCQNLHFTMLNTNDLDGNNQLAAAQVNWLKNDLKSSEADWNIVVLHKAMYSNGSHYADKDVIALRNQLTPLFAQLGVDVVIAGHDHTYLRTEAQGVQYVLAGTSGVKFYIAKSPEETASQFPPALALVDTEGPIFAAYEAKGDTLTYTAYMMDEATGALREIDSFTLQKDIELRPVLRPEWETLRVGTPVTGEDWGAVALPLSLLLAAGFVLYLLQRKRTEAAEA